MLFDVRVTAFDPQAAVDPVEALMRLFKIERAFAREVVHRLPRVIKRGVSLDTAQRLSQVLERIGARVEILVSERTQVGAPPEKTRAERVDAAMARGEAANTPSPSGARATVGRAGLPPPASAALAQAPAPTASQQAQALAQAQPAMARRSMPSAVQRLEAAAAMANAAASLPNPALQEDAAARPVSGVLEARTSRALREQLSQSRPSLSAASAVDPRLTETRAEPRQADVRARQSQAQSFDAEMPSASVRALLTSTGDDAMVGRVSLPMGSWADGADDDSRVAVQPSRASLPHAAPANESQRQSQVGLPAPKPSVKEILARRSLTQTGSHPEAPGRGSKLPGELSGAILSPPQKLVLPAFGARGSSVADEIEELPGALELRRKRAALTWLLLLLASLVTAGLFGLLTLFKIVGQRRRRLAQLRELQASALLVNQLQLPELYNCVKQLAIRLEISPSPRLYVAERCPGKVQSFVQRGGLVLVLDAGLLSSAARFDAGYVVQFALAHEMAAYALDQQRWSRQALAGLWASVRKGDLLSADALATKLMADRNEAVRALGSLLCGPELAHLLDLAELERQTTSQEQDAQLHGDNIADASYLLPRIAHLRKQSINSKV